jgi:hypothetical protein
LEPQVGIVSSDIAHRTIEQTSFFQNNNALFMSTSLPGNGPAGLSSAAVANHS